MSVQRFIVVRIHGSVTAVEIWTAGQARFGVNSYFNVSAASLNRLRDFWRKYPKRFHVWRGEFSKATKGRYREWVRRTGRGSLDSLQTRGHEHATGK